MINELFQTEGRSIFTFNKGVLITQVIPCEIKRKEYNSNLGIELDTITRTDNSFRGEAVEFICVHQNMILIKATRHAFIHKLPVEDWENVWDAFTVPDGMRLEDFI